MLSFKCLFHKHIKLFGLIIAVSSLTSCSGFRNGLHSLIAFKLAARDFNNEKYDASIQHFDRVINNLPANSDKEDPKRSAILYYCRGVAYIKSMNKNCAEGILDLEKASRLVEEAYKINSSDRAALDKLASDISSARKICNK